jgi:hypothetical protein
MRSTKNKHNHRTCGEKDAISAQKLSRLRPFLTVFSQETVGQLASFGPTYHAFGVIGTALSKKIETAELCKSGPDNSKRIVVTPFPRQPTGVSSGVYGERMAERGEHRDIIVCHCHFRKTDTEYDRKPDIKWLNCTAK